MAVEVVAGAGSEVVPMEVEAGAGSEVVSMEVEAGAGSEVVPMEVEAGAGSEVAMEVEAEEPVMEMKEAAEAAVMEMKEAAEAAEAAKVALGTAEADCSAAAAQSATEEHPLAPVMSRRGLLQ